MDTAIWIIAAGLWAHAALYGYHLLVQHRLNDRAYSRLLEQLDQSTLAIHTRDQANVANGERWQARESELLSRMTWLETTLRNAMTITGIEK